MFYSVLIHCFFVRSYSYGDGLKCTTSYSLQQYRVSSQRWYLIYTSAIVGAQRPLFSLRNEKRLPRRAINRLGVQQADLFGWNGDFRQEPRSSRHSGIQRPLLQDRFYPLVLLGTQRLLIFYTTHIFCQGPPLWSGSVPSLRIDILQEDTFPPIPLYVQITYFQVCFLFFP